jgi:glycine oxidase
MVPRLKTDIAIAGAGLIGLSVALELHSRGMSVVLLDTAQAISGASRAAAGMLASEDPHNPPELRDLSIWSLSLYDRFLRRVEALSGTAVPYQTDMAVQYLDDGSFVRLAERSIDPRQLAASALQAVSNSGIPLLQDCCRIDINERAEHVELRPEHGPAVSAAQLVHASGAWFAGRPKMAPRKGQMLRVRMPPGVHINAVHRSSRIYAVPRRYGPQAGSVVIGATDEDAGFDLQISQQALDDLRARTAALIPALGSTEDAPQVEAWAGVRPATADRLPAIGRVPGTERQWLAGGHYRNGILLAPATAVAIADMLENRATTIDMRSFDPARLV